MSDDFDDLVKGWLRDRGATDETAIEAVASRVVALPPRRRRQPTALVAAATIIVAIGLAAFGLVPRFDSVSSEPSGPVAPDPAAFAGDQRLARCGATVESAVDVFEMPHARDYRLHLPAMLVAPELDLDAPAFVVVFRGMHRFPVLGAPPPSGETWPPRSLAPGHHDMCVLVGSDPATADLNIYSDVDVTGLTVTVDAGETPFPSAGSPSTTASTPDSAPSSTAEPAPAWASGLAGQLDCDGLVSQLGGEVTDGVAREVVGPTPEGALRAFLGPPSPYSNLPVGGYSTLNETLHWASYRHLAGGRSKVVIVVTDTGPGRSPGWSVVALRACDPSEFDPAYALTYPITIWTDATGTRASTTRIVASPGPGHCGWESAIFLALGDVTYVRDPDGLSGLWTVPRFDPRATLPRNAQDSGFHSVLGALWIVPGGDAYLVLEDRSERWPRLDPSIGCT